LVTAKNLEQFVVRPEKKGFVATTEPGASAWWVLETPVGTGVPEGYHPGT